MLTCPSRRARTTRAVPPLSFAALLLAAPVLAALGCADSPTALPTHTSPPAGGRAPATPPGGSGKV
jgi:hypothetical protein